jgi:ABC-2 type transport system ATP-binding protein
MLELLALRKRFGDVLALDDCSFSAQPGRVLGFLGRNGAGKTTAMRAIFGLVAPDAGSVRWRGLPVTGEMRSRFGYMPEERGLYPRMRVADEIAYFGRLRGLKVAVAEYQAAHWLERLHLTESATTTLEKLSHGNQQRVQLAVSLIGNPELLVLDEPFSGLDPIAADTLSSVIRDEARAGKAIVFSSHQLDLVEDVCDDIAVITRGSVVLTGSLEEIRRRSRVRYVEVGFDRDVGQRRVHEVASSLEGVTVVSETESAVRFRLPATSGPEEVFAALGQLGPLERFRFEPPCLADIFREAAGEWAD